MDRVTVPLHIEGDRIFVDVTLRTTSSGEHQSRAWIDTGGGGFMLTEAFARTLGVEWDETLHEQGTEYGRATRMPTVSIDDFTFELDPARVFVTINKDNLLPPVAPGSADCFLPGHVMSQYHVVFDYPNATLTLSTERAIEGTGDTMPMPVARPSGFPRTEVNVDGVAYGFLVDTGASFSMVSEVVLKRWGSAHPDWRRYQGAFGEASTLGGTTLETLFVGGARWGSFDLEEFGVVSQPEGTFERWMTSMMAAPIVGALGGNVLKRFSVDLNYPNERLVLSRR